MFAKDELLNTPELLRSFLQKMMGTTRKLPDEMKRQLIVTKINLKSLLTATNTSSLNAVIQSGDIYNCSSTTETTNLLALAVCTANIEACKLFLQYFSDLKNPSYFVEGYRQNYSWLHLALDPHAHIGNAQFKEELLNINARLEVIDLLGNKGADPNWVGDGVYRNPPLAAGFPSGRFYDTETTKQLRIQLIACGADPNIQGSSFYLSKHSIDELNAGLELVRKKSSTVKL